LKELGFLLLKIFFISFQLMATIEIRQTATMPAIKAILIFIKLNDKRKGFLSRLLNDSSELMKCRNGLLN